jgi:protein TonB
MASSQILLPLANQKHVAPSSLAPHCRDHKMATDDRMFSTYERTAVRQDPKATAVAVVVNGFLLVTAVLVGATTVRSVAAITPTHVVTLIAPVSVPLPKAAPKPVVMSGGGGHPTIAPVSRGTPPKLALARAAVLAVNQPRLEARLPIEPAVNVQTELKLAKSDMSVLGMSTAAPTVISSLGNGSGAGLGAGSGSGMGSGTGSNYGGGVFKVGGGVAAPQVLSAPEPTFTEEARQAKVNGKVLVYLQVSPEGRPMHVRVIKGLGMGLDEKAVEAVRQYRFKPALREGHPVTVEMNIDVNFQIL